MVVSQAIEVNLVEEPGITLKSSYEFMGRQVDGRDLLGYTNKTTRNTFDHREFHKQFVEAVELNITNCTEDNEDFVYTLTMYDAFGKDDNCKKQYVRKGSDNKLFCSCRIFEMKGVLCSHAIKVLGDIMNSKEIHDQYILKRWTKIARSEYVQNMHGYEIQADPKLQQTSRYMSLRSIFTRISSKASESEKNI
ncbi:hypothetical protein Dsin_006088 [Dipteronia sinensis]|uniref:Protein FAR1-RELATED SEQUENCE n=1 Tax=Dipteronia sinensis TaxID=43782 RepID=A0AAE0AXR1_9ROSI|nr:hypothetical protein Dsin_006088 [Dipteronia sinensis]